MPTVQHLVHQTIAQVVGRAVGVSEGGGQLGEPVVQRPAAILDQPVGEQYERGAWIQPAEVLGDVFRRGDTGGRPALSME